MLGYASLPIPPLPEGPFDVVVADPPWRYVAWSEKGGSRAPEELHYPTLTLDDIATIPVADVCAPNTHLGLWVTGPLLVAGAHLRILESWGFVPSSIGFVWGKVNKKSMNGRFFSPIGPEDFFMGLGHTTRQNVEYVVLGRRGRPKRHSNAVRQLIIEPRREHSRKPDTFYRDMERYGGPDARRLDMFSREDRPGWTSWGLEAGKFNKKGSTK